MLRNYWKIIAMLAALLAGAAVHADAVPPDWENDAARLVVFLGEPISLDLVPHEPCEFCIIMNSHYRARYRILDVIYGEAPGSEIAFDVYDHYGKPSFSRYDHVLLYLLRRPDGSYVHKKYTYDAVFRTTDGQWAGCAVVLRRDERPAVAPRPMAFDDSAWLPVSRPEPEEIAKDFPPSLFDVRGKRAYCKQGYALEELLANRRAHMGKWMSNWLPRE